MDDPQNTYSYNAPEYINFGSFSIEDDHNADSWFDQVIDAENIPPELEGNSMTPAGKQAVLRCPTNGDPCCLGDNGNFQEKLQNIENFKGSESGAKSQSRRSSRRMSDRQRKMKLAKMRAERRLTQSVERPPLKKQKVSITKGKQRPTVSHDGNNLNSSKPKAQLTVPETPTVLKRRNAPGKVKNSEEQELEKVQQLQKEMIEKLHKNEESLKAAISGAGEPVKKMVIPVTKPLVVHFHTDDRLKRHTEQSEHRSYKEVDFKAMLRKRPSSLVNNPKSGHTIPEPFNLSKGSKRKHEEANASEFISTAEQVLSFHKRTPSRYHLRSRQKEMEGPSPVKMAKPKLTNPKTPMLQTKQRYRPVTCKSSVELEREELEKIQQYKFKAQELNTRILEGGPFVPKKPPMKEPTKPIGFNLEIEKRIQQREKKDEEEDISFTFHSRPCPSKILADVVGVPQKKLLPVTVPQSPAFALKNRVRMVQTWEEEVQEEVPVIKANPVPHYGVPFKPKLVEQKSLEVCPFSFEERDKERQLQKERKLDELRNEHVFKFKAQPLPHFDHISLPEKKVKIATQQEPFDLEIDKRGANRVQRWQQQMENEIRQQKEMAVFKARPNTVIHQEPFVPKKENRSISEQESFELATERRARERQEFEKRLKEAETQKMILEEEERKYHEEQEKEEISKLRQELVHKAQPVRKYKTVEVKASDVPLTIPISPKFSDRFKC
ncbi:hypothetical protein GDO86_014652 [Hymenochirus boettgeri]|uniref:Targeting protein for Xklp2 n=1 Tax=Hymenochirus boettgeri TaxID=247094 RepID=A0A8T2JUU2_9PIPI|nr:hypothetical protein GDO86_014652 [Hymenochirus boettgeri]